MATTIRSKDQITFDNPITLKDLEPKPVKVKFKKLQPHAVMPTQATAGAANFDFVCTRIEKREVNKYTLFFGIAVEVPEGYKMVIVPRSSITGTDAIQQNSPGQVDSDYRGELQLRITVLPTWVPLITDQEGVISIGNFQYPDVPFKVGDRVAQGFLERVIPVEFEETDTISDSVRGTAGFGSTGKSAILPETKTA